MFRLLLCAILLHRSFGVYGFVNITKDYKDPICNMRLHDDKYFSVLSGIRIPTKDNGRINYMWGYENEYDKLLYCARIRSEKKTRATDVYSYGIAKDEIDGFINCIQVIDMRSPKKGGIVQLHPGEINSILLTLRFQSFKDEDMDYVISIFGESKKH